MFPQSEWYHPSRFLAQEALPDLGDAASGHKEPAVQPWMMVAPVISMGITG